MPGDVSQKDLIVRLRGEECDEFSFYSDSDEAVITQHRLYRWGDTVIAIGEINYPNQWDDEPFDAKCAELEAAINDRVSGSSC